MAGRWFFVLLCIQLISVIRDQAACEVLGVSHSVYYRVESLSVGQENMRLAIEGGRAGHI